MNLINDNDVTIRKVYTENPLKRKDSHYVHTNDGHELYLLLKGDVSFSIDGQIHKLSPYDLLIINNKEIHRTIVHSDIPHERIYLYFNPSIVARLNSEKLNLLKIFEDRKLGYGNKIDQKLVRESNIPEYILQIYEWSKSDLPEKNAMIMSILVQLIVKVTNIFSYNELDEKIREDSSYNGKIYHILNYISANLHRKITLDELEKNFYINKYYLCHLFKKVTGFTLIEYVTYKKVTLAKDYLLKGYAINTICMSLGFEDYSSFYRIFKKIVKISPQKYLEKYTKS
jgi:AraC-like DNA-binding protein